MERSIFISLLLACCLGIALFLLIARAQMHTSAEPVTPPSGPSSLPTVEEKEERNPLSLSDRDEEEGKLFQETKQSPTSQKDQENDTVIPEESPRVSTGVHASSPSVLSYAEERLSADFDFVAVHVHWANESDFPRVLSESLSGTEKTIVVFWNAMDYKKEIQDEFSFASILAGDRDSYISSFRDQVAAYPGMVYIIPFEEVNGDWTPWSVVKREYGDLAEYKAAFRYLRDKFRDVSNVKFGWVVNNVSVPNTKENSIENYYPGSDYVDFIGVNGFNFGDPWISFDQVFTPVVAELREYNKPLYITSIGTAEGPKKSEWVRDFLAHPILTDGQVQGWIWFNEDKERDWRFWSDAETEEVFREYLKEQQGGNLDSMDDLTFIPSYFANS